MFATLQCHVKTSQLQPTKLNLDYDPYGVKVCVLLSCTANRQGH